MVVVWSVVSALIAAGVLATLKLSAGHLWDRCRVAADSRLIELDMASSSWVLPYPVNLDPTITPEWRPPDAVALAAAGRRVFSFELTSRLKKRATIRSIQAIIDSIAPTPNGTLFFAPPQGDTEKGQIGFDLTSTDLNGMIMDSGMITARKYIGDRTVELEKGQTVGFKVTVHADNNFDIRYRVRVSFSQGKDVIIDDRGQSFRITTYPGSAQAAYTITRLSPDSTFGAYPCSWPDGCYRSFFNVRVE
ncbi:hypothetical protein [Mycobacteroides abscessus]|uniref:hypothetical protein n=1 Tax=Mycobacteroides abscessus TaxID=36809 RepID=UPI001056EEEC|nr:hypothetical protein [Mycobacteroides abscessus]